MPAHLYFVTGKGGVGKTTVAAALAQRLARGRRRVLLVETDGGERSLAALFGSGALGAEPTPLGGGLSGLRLEPRALVEAYFRRLLRLPFLARRLFASGTFRAVTAAAPGVSEFVILEHLLHWTAAGRFRRAAYDAVVVDGPASGHAVRLLCTPSQLARLVPRGPLTGSVARLQALITDPAHTRAVLVALPEEMAIAEALETRAALAMAGVALAPPVLNRVWPKRFSAADATVIAARADRAAPLIAAARLALAARRDYEAQAARLHEAFGVAPLPLPERPGATFDATALAVVGRALGPALGDDDGD